MPKEPESGLKAIPSIPVQWTADSANSGCWTVRTEPLGFSKNVVIRTPDLEAIRQVPGNRLHPLKGDRHGQWAIRINDQWRICFRWHDGNALDVEITDYH